MSTPAIHALDIEKTFGLTRAVAGASVTVKQGEVVALLGPSGSGKTTLLRIIAGFEVPDGGRVEIGGRQVAGDGAWEEPDRRRIGMVFQDGALFPHLSVAANVSFGCSRPGRAEECLELVGMAGRATSYPHELSGGERQRIALARALAADPDVVLFDEPFASLDAGLRVSLREEVAAILRRAGASALLVTHDQDEALSLADTVAVMRAGRIEQVGTPEEVYARPASRWLAGFLGEADVVPGTVVDGVVDCELGRFPAEGELRGAVEVVLRPECLALAVHRTDGARGDGPPLPASKGTEARVVGRSFHGHDQLVRLELPSGQHVRSRRPGFAACWPGDVVRVWIEGPVNVLAPASPEG